MKSLFPRFFSAQMLVACCASVSCFQGALAQQTPFAALQQARIDQNIGAAVPHDLAFTNEQGRLVHLGDFFGSKPCILVLAYYHCPELCPMSLRHLVEGLNGIALNAGNDFDVIVVSFDPGETPADAAGARAQYVRGYRRRRYNSSGGDGWHFLTGSEVAISRLTSVVGFHYRYDPASKRFAHAAGAIVLTPQGMVSTCFFGIDYAPASLEGALRDAAARHGSRVNEPQQQYCFAYDPNASKTTRIVTRIIQGAGAITVVMLVGYIVTHLGSRASAPGGRP